jgi:HD-like signal output (HDOD) protein
MDGVSPPSLNVTLPPRVGSGGEVDARMAAMAGRGALLRLLRSFRYFQHWPDEELSELGGALALRKLTPGERLIDFGSVDHRDYFLIDGALNLTAVGDRAFSLSAREVDAGFPVAHLRPSRYRVVAAKPSHLLAIDSVALRRPPAQVRTSRFLVPQRAVAGSWQSHPAWAELVRELEQGTLPIPSLPAVAHRVSEQLQRDDVNLGRVAQLISTESGLAAKLVKVANSAMFKREQHCETVQDALTRIGLNSARQLVLAFASERLFRSVDAMVRKHSMRLWQHSVEIAALAMVLARMTPPLAPDRALLIGLLHEIGGLAVLALLQRYTDLVADEKMLQDILDAATPRVSAHVLAAWEFSPDVVNAAMDADNWFRDGGRDPDYTDLLVVAHLHALVRQREFSQLPRIDETPAFGKLALGELSPKLSLLVLDEARAQVQEMRSLLA